METRSLCLLRWKRREAYVCVKHKIERITQHTLRITVSKVTCVSEVKFFDVFIIRVSTNGIWSATVKKKQVLDIFSNLNHGQPMGLRGVGVLKKNEIYIRKNSLSNVLPSRKPKK